MRNKNSFSTYIKLGLPLRQGGEVLQNLLQYSPFFFSPFKFQFEVQHRVQLRVRTPCGAVVLVVGQGCHNETPQLGSKNNRNVLVSAVEAEQAKAKGYQGQVLTAGLFPLENIPHRAVLSYGKQRKGEAAWCLFL